MDSLLSSTLLKLALPVAGTTIGLLVARRRGISLPEDVGLRRPAVAHLLGWLGIWTAWVAVSEVLVRALGLEQAQPWPEYPALIVAPRVLAIGIAGPVLEELLFRGFLLDRLRRTALGTTGAIALLAVGWAGIHYRYGVGSVVLIAFDGVLLGFARTRGGSLWIPIAMHALGNLFSISQSLAIL